MNERYSIQPAYKQPDKFFICQDVGGSFAEVFQGMQSTNHRNAAAGLVRRANAYAEAVELLRRIQVLTDFDEDKLNGMETGEILCDVDNEVRAFLAKVEAV